MPRVALRAIQIGAIAVVVLALPFVVFDLDRFLIPKELALDCTAIVAGLAAFGMVRKSAGGSEDRFLGAYLALGVLSCVLATNRWLGLRGLAVSAAGIALFWTAGALRERGVQHQVLAGVALAVVVAAAMCLLQAYGLRLSIFAATRAPGGTLGNRNFVAHIAALGLPACMLVAMTRRVALPGIAIVSAALVLTRSRAAWLAAAAMLIVFVLTIAVLRHREVLRRLALIMVSMAAGAVAALILPNALHWRSHNPYLQSVQDVANYQRGSGRGRLVQYGSTMLVALRHPILGVGPGNWAVEYPAHVRRDDPSLDPSQPGMTYNPWPSSDWMAFLAERGVPATIALVLALFTIARRQRPPLERAALLATIAAAIVAGMFDAVLLLAAPAFLFWTTIGALTGEPVDMAPVARRRTLLFAVALAASLAGAIYAGAQVVAMRWFDRGGRGDLTQAAELDPGSYRIHLRLAQTGRSRCEHAKVAHALFPHAVEATALSRGCR